MIIIKRLKIKRVTDGTDGGGGHAKVDQNLEVTENELEVTLYEPQKKKTFLIFLESFEFITIFYLACYKTRLFQFIKF